MLDKRTSDLIQELFKDQLCSSCGQPASRIRFEHFYCLNCFLDHGRPINYVPHIRKFRTPKR